VGPETKKVIDEREGAVELQQNPDQDPNELKERVLLEQLARLNTSSLSLGRE